MFFWTFVVWWRIDWPPRVQVLTVNILHSPCRICHHLLLTCTFTRRLFIKAHLWAHFVVIRADEKLRYISTHPDSGSIFRLVAVSIFAIAGLHKSTKYLFNRGHLPSPRSTLAWSSIFLDMYCILFCSAFFEYLGNCFECFSRNVNGNI